MNLVIDIGNTSAKFAIFNNDKIIDLSNEAHFSFGTIIKKTKLFKGITHAIFSSVVDDRIRFPSIIKKKFFILVLKDSTLLPVKNRYTTPKTLGNDRIANAVGGVTLFPKKNILIIDMGTCIKYDFIDHKKNYFGGAISPGFHMRFRALNHFTGKLPLIAPSDKFPLIGNSTEKSILSGVTNGIIHEIKGMIAQYKRNHKDFKAVLTGGDAPFFANHLKNSIFAAPHLTLHGLNEILNYNVRKNS